MGKTTTTTGRVLYATTAIALSALTACGGGGNTGDSSGEGNGSGGSGDSFALQATTLVILSHTPSDEAVQVALDASIVIGFDGLLSADCLHEPDTWLRRSEDADLGDPSADIRGTFAITSGGNTMVFQPEAPLLAETDYAFQLSALTCDLDGKLLEEEYRFEFRSFDQTPPQVLHANFADGATEVDRLTDLIVTFSEAIGARSISPATLYLRDVFGTDYPVSASIQTHTIVVDPTIHLPGDRSFVLVARGGNSGLEDRAGNPLTESWSVHFRTAADLQKPTVLATWPSGTSISPRIVPSLDFDESVDPSSAETSTLRFRDEFGNFIAYRVIASEDQTTLLLAPTRILTVGRRYTVEAIGGPGALTDVSGNPLDTAALLQFRVGTDASPPRLLNSRPASDETSVSLNVQPSLIFDESLDAGTISNETVRLEITATGDEVPCTVTPVSGSFRVSLELSSTLTPGTDYRLIVRGGPDGIRDRAGNVLEMDLIRPFATTTDSTLPSLMISPLNGAVIASVDTDVVIIADAPLDPTSVGPTKIYLQDAVGVQIDGSIQMSHGNRVIRFRPDHDLTGPQPFFVTVIGGSHGVREASGNWLDDDLTSQFRLASTPDTIAPLVAVTLNATSESRVSNRVMPPAGFEIDVVVFDQTTFNQDLASIALHLTGPDGQIERLDDDIVYRFARIDNRRLTFSVTPDQALEPGAYSLRATATDLSGNARTTDPVEFEVTNPTAAAVPFERTQIVWVRFDLDRDANQRGDFQDDLIRLGLGTGSDPIGKNRQMFELVRDGVLRRAHELFGRKPEGGRKQLGSIAVRFTPREPLGVPSMQIACGGFDPEGAPNRSFGDSTSGTLGRAFYDYRNDVPNDNNTLLDPGVGVFPSELFLFESEAHLALFPAFITTFAEVFTPMAPDLGGIPFGSHPDDGIVLEPEFDVVAATPSARARHNALLRAADQWATAIGTILTHECGHSIGLVAPGRLSNELHGDASLHNEFSNATDIMGAAVGYDGLISLRFEFRDLNLAYLRHRMVLR